MILADGQHASQTLQNDFCTFLNNFKDIFDYRTDSIQSLLLTLAGRSQAQSLVELSLEPLFKFQFPAIYSAIDAMFNPSRQSSTPNTKTEKTTEDKKQKKRKNKKPQKDKTKKNKSGRQEATKTITFDAGVFEATRAKWSAFMHVAQPLPREDQPIMLVIDVTPNSRVHAHATPGRGFTHGNNPVGTPVTIGYAASVLGMIPERLENDTKWCLPVDVEGMFTTASKVSGLGEGLTAVEAAEKQLQRLPQQFKDGRLVLVLMDSGYTSLEPQAPNHVHIARARTNRTGHRQPIIDDSQPNRRGRPRKYGEKLRFCSTDPETPASTPDDITETAITYRGKNVLLRTFSWYDVLLEGHSKPVNVFSYQIISMQSNQPLYERPFVRVISGERKDEISGADAFKYYMSRFDIEHMFRFFKKNLLFDKSQTSNLNHQVNWWWMCMFAYKLLYHARWAAGQDNRRWMPRRLEGRAATPSQAQRALAGIFREFGITPPVPKPRGKSPGAKKGSTRTPKTKHKPLKRTLSQPKKAA